MLAEYGLVVAQGIEKLRDQLPAILQDAGNGLPARVRETLAERLAQWRSWDERVRHYDRQIAQLAAASKPAQRLMGIAGIGPLTTTAVVASVGGAKVFASGRQFAAWLGMVPRQHSSGGKFRLGAITKRGDAYLRKLLIHGAQRSHDVRAARGRLEPLGHVQEFRGANVAAMALAAKHARIIRAMLAKGEAYRAA